jgi:hypothetical protein
VRIGGWYFIFSFCRKPQEKFGIARQARGRLTEGTTTAAEKHSRVSPFVLILPAASSRRIFNLFTEWMTCATRLNVPDELPPLADP